MTKNVKLRVFTSDDKQLLFHLLQLYIYDLEGSGIRGIQIDYETGIYSFPSFDSLFEVSSRVPIGIYLDAMPIGFALLYEPLAPGADYDIAEFFVKRAFRRRGVGSKAVALLAGEYTGTFIVTALSENEAAVRFWQSAISKNVALSLEGGSPHYDPQFVDYKFSSQSHLDDTINADSH